MCINMVNLLEIEQSEELCNCDSIRGHTKIIVLVFVMKVKICIRNVAVSYTLWSGLQDSFLSENYFHGYVHRHWYPKTC